ncbi:hypothetical protein LZC95_20155 [Pendulispora brunnea]|uniref:Uncharacterized protein n=1 Tax=Pendulispora brunnea TaxID=2905690 RepID=A0ABZ2KKC2_9BACT
MSGTKLGGLITEIATLKNDVRPETYVQTEAQIRNLMRGVPACVRDDLALSAQRLADLSALAQRNPKIRHKAQAAIRTLQEAQQPFAALNETTGLMDLMDGCGNLDSALSDANTLFLLSELPEYR